MADLAIDKTHIILVDALIKKGNKILISQRSWEESHAPGKWTIPGGKVEKEKKETWNIIEKTLEKEAFEETGIKIKKEVALLSNNSFIRSTGHHVVSLNFACQWKSGKAKPLEDTINIHWISKNEINKFDFAPSIKGIIKMGFKYKL